MIQFIRWFGENDSDNQGAAENFKLAAEALLKAIRVKIWPPITNKDGSFRGVDVRVREVKATRDGKEVKAITTDLFNVPLTIKEAEDAVRQDFIDQMLQLTREGKEVPAWLSKLLTYNGKLNVFKEVYRSLVISSGAKLTMEEEEMLQDPSLRDEILDTNQLDFSDSLLENVKNLLSTLFVTKEVPVLNSKGEPMISKAGIPITKTEVVHHIPSSTVFMLAKQMLVGVDFSSEHFLSQLAYNANQIGGKSNPQAQSVFNFLSEMYILAFSKDIYDFTDSTGKKQQRFISPLIKMTNNELLIFNANEDIIHRYTKVSMRDGRKQDTGKFIYQAAKQLKEHPVMIGKESTADMSNEQLYNLLLVTYRKGHAADFIAGLRSGIGSLITRDPFVGITRLENKDGEVDEQGNPVYSMHHRYVKNRAIGAQESVDDRIREVVIKVVESSYEARKDKADAVLSLVGNKDMRSVNKVQSIFKLLDVKNFSQFFGTENQAEIILESLKNIFQLVKNKDLSTEGKKDELLGNINGYVGSIVDIIATTRNFGGNTSYITGDKQRNYMFVTGSWLTRIHEYLTKVREASTRGGAFQLPDFLRKENLGYKFFQHNPYLKSGLGRLIEHDSHKTQLRINGVTHSDDTMSTKYKNEQTVGWITRMFSYGFESMLNKTAKEGKYIQFCYTRSNKPKIYGHVIPITSHSATDGHIIAALTQQVERRSWMDSLAFHPVEIGGRKYASGMKIAGDKEQACLRFFEGLPDTEIAEKLKTDQGRKQLLNMVKNQFNHDANDVFFYLDANRAFTKREHGVDIEHNSPALKAALIRKLETYELINDGAYKTYEEQFKSQLKKRNIEYPQYKYHQMLHTYIAVQEFYKLNYVNGHFINQFYTGDIGQYKHIADLTNGASGPVSPGQLGVANDVFGMPTEIVIMVADDDSHYFNKWNDFAKGLEGIYGIDYNLTTAQMFYLPKWRNHLEAGYSHYYQLGDVIKPVLYFIDKCGISRFSKNAGVELTPTLQEMFPELKELAQEMEKNNIMELHMASAFKVGRPARTLKNGETISQHLETHTDHNGVVIVPTKHYSIQSNPRSSEGEITNFSQLTYFINVNGKNADVAKAIYEIDGLLTDLSFDKFKKRLKYVKNPDGTFTYDEKEVRRLIIESITDVPGSERFAELLSAKEGKDYVVPLNFPALVGKVHISFMSSASKRSIKAVHGTGSKLVLQTPKGVVVHRVGGQVLTYKQLSEAQKKMVDKFYTLPYAVQRGLRTKFGAYALNNNFTTWEENKKFIRDYSQLTDAEKEMVDNINDESVYMVPTKLLMKSDVNSYTGRVAEVIAPAWWLKMKGYEDGEIVYPDFLTKLQFAVRIPTTGIHSAIPFKVVASTNSSSNIIIAPEELVALHESDFDGDSLFAVRAEILFKKEGSIKRLLTLKNPDGTVAVEPGQRLGWPHGFEIDNFEQMNMIQGSTDTELKFNEFDKQLATYKKLMETYIELGYNKEIDKDTAREHMLNYKLAYEAYEGTLKNKKAYAMLYMLLHDRNKEDMGQPISFDPIKKDLFDLDLELYHPSKSIKVYGKDGAVTPEFIVLMKQDSPDIEIVQKFKEWGITAENISKVIAIDPEANTFKITNKEIKNNIFKDNSIGVITKLKLIYGKIDMNEQRNPNNLLHQVKDYIDKSESNSREKIVLLMGKGLSYIYYINPEAFKIDNHGNKFEFYLNKSYNTIGQYLNFSEILRRINVFGLMKSEPQLFEILVGQSSQNEKVKVLLILLAIGVPLFDIICFLRQPVLQNNNIKRTIKQYNNNIGFENTILQINTIELINCIVDSQNALATNLDNNKYYLIQNQVLNDYTRILNIGKHVLNFANELNILKSFNIPISETMKIAKQKFNWGIAITKNMMPPNYLAAEAAYNDSCEILDELLVFKSKAVQKLAKTLLQRYLGYDNIELQSSLLSNFEKYFVCKSIEFEDTDKIWARDYNLNVTRRKERLVNPINNWKNNFGDQINELADIEKFKSNLFLQYFTAVKRKGNYNIKWNVGTNIDNDELSLKLKADLLMLPKDFILNVYKYFTLTSGLKYGFKGISYLLDAEIILPQLKKFKSMSEDLSQGGDRFKEFADHYMLYYVLNNYGTIIKNVQLTENIWITSNEDKINLSRNRNTDFVIPRNKKFEGINTSNSPPIILVKNPLSKKTGIGILINENMQARYDEYAFQEVNILQHHNLDYAFIVGAENYTYPLSFGKSEMIIPAKSNEIGKARIHVELGSQLCHQLAQVGENVWVYDSIDIFRLTQLKYKIIKVKFEEEIIDYEGVSVSIFKEVRYSMERM